jgi:hypothetical protein
VSDWPILAGVVTIIAIGLAVMLLIDWIGL